jgi:hypothetical protein
MRPMRVSLAVDANVLRNAPRCHPTVCCHFAQLCGIQTIHSTSQQKETSDRRCDNHNT